MAVTCLRVIRRLYQHLKGYLWIMARLSRLFNAVASGKTPIHPLLLALWPILSLYSSNLGEAVLRQLLVPLLIASAAVFLFWLLLTRVYGDRVKAGVASSAFWLLFFSYGRFASRAGEAAASLTCVVILLLVVVLLRLTSTPLKRVSSVIVTLSVCVVIVPVAAIVLYEIGRVRVAHIDLAPANTQPMQGTKRQSVSYPDIYYIILDGYGRNDVLRDLYGLDNAMMIRFLKQNGFHVASRARANYCQSALSLSSSMNCVYLDEIAERAKRSQRDRLPLYELIEHSYAARFLKQHGYKTVSFQSGYRGTEVTCADTYLRPAFAIDEFQYYLCQHTPLPQISRAVSVLFGKTDGLDYYEVTRRRISFTFDHLADPARTEGPVFVFAHIIAPHPPFVFDCNGGRVAHTRGFSLFDGSHFVANGGTQEEYVQRYRDQLAFVNARMKDVLTGLLSNRRKQTVIILQSDHGPGSRLNWEDLNQTDARERLSILQALHLPDFDQKALPADLTPVNTFRIVFNHYFHTDYPVLKNHSYYSKWSRPYDFVEVTSALENDTEEP